MSLDDYFPAYRSKQLGPVKVFSVPRAGQGSVDPVQLVVEDALNVTHTVHMKREDVTREARSVANELRQRGYGVGVEWDLSFFVDRVEENNRRDKPAATLEPVVLNVSAIRMPNVPFEAYSMIVTDSAGLAVSIGETYNFEEVTRKVQCLQDTLTRRGYTVRDVRLPEKC